MAVGWGMGREILQPTKIPTSLQAPPSPKSAPAPKVTPPLHPPAGPSCQRLPMPRPCLPRARTMGAFWAGGTLLPPEPFRKGAVGQGREWPLLGGYFLFHEGSKKGGPLWACPGYLPGIVATGGRRQETGDVYPAENRVAKRLQSSL